MSKEASEFPVTVRDLKAMLEGIPDDLPVFRISDYWGDCMPIRQESLPHITTVQELEFEHGRAFHHGPREHLVDHKVLREVKVLDMGGA